MEFCFKVLWVQVADVCTYVFGVLQVCVAKNKVLLKLTRREGEYRLLGTFPGDRF